jgi:hypothetical protein
MLCFYNSIHPNSDKPKPNPIHRTVVGAGPRACPVNGQPQGVAPTQKYSAIFDHNLSNFSKSNGRSEKKLKRFKKLVTDT